MSNDEFKRRNNPPNRTQPKQTKKTSVNKKSSPNKSRKKKKKKKVIIFRTVIFIFFLLVVLIATCGSYLINLFNKMDKVDLDKNNLGISSEEELSKYGEYDKVVNIALFGVDSPTGQNGRSDSMMILTMDPINNKIKITSLMRDSYVSIDGYDNDKLNHAYAFGGPELAIKTINENFGLNIEDFATVNFSSLPKIIDILGGIDIELTDDEVNYINFYIDELNRINGTSSPNIYTSGLQKLDGTQALAYSRIRYTDGGDYERTHRHRVVLSSLFEITSKLPISSYPSLLNKILPLVQTSLKTSDILSLGGKMVSIANGTLLQSRYPKDESCWGDTIDGIYYLVFDKEATKDQIRNFIFGNAEN